MPGNLGRPRNTGTDRTAGADQKDHPAEVVRTTRAGEAHFFGDFGGRFDNAWFARLRRGHVAVSMSRGG
jgi:hypothetical protein